MRWRPPVFPWQKEYYAWAQGRGAGRSFAIPATNHAEMYPKAKLTDVLDALSRILATPEIVEQWRVVGLKLEPGTEFRLWDDDDYAYACQLTNDYAHWFRMKQRLEDHWSPYSMLPAVMREIETGSIDKGDRRGIISFLKLHTDACLVDDVT